jgi:hypothetical protein
MDNYDAYLRSPVCPSIGFCTIVLLLVHTRVVNNEPILAILHIMWCILGGAIMAICAPIVLLTVIPGILFTLWYQGWTVCHKIIGETNPYEEVIETIQTIETGACNPQC